MDAVPEVKKYDWTCAGCGRQTYDYYVVHDSVWLSVMPSKKGLLHFSCLENRLGRRLTLDDLKDCPANDLIRVGYTMAIQDMVE